MRSRQIAAASPSDKRLQRRIVTEEPASCCPGKTLQFKEQETSWMVRTSTQKAIQEATFLKLLSSAESFARGQSNGSQFLARAQAHSLSRLFSAAKHGGSRSRCRAAAPLARLPGACSTAC